MTDHRAQVLQTLRTLEAWGHDRAWSGTDQYDGLNATRVPTLVTRTALGRRVVIQAVKRSPVDLRPLLGIGPGVNAVSLAWVARAYAMNGFLPTSEAARRLRMALDALGGLRLDYDEPCWGYHFDFQSRVFFYPRSTPNSIATVFAGMAFLDAYESGGDPGLLELAHGAGRFFLARVPQTPDRPGAFFGYLPGDRSPIHNANLLTCALLARVSALTGDERMRAAAEDGVRWSVRRQHADGSWPYGERRNLQWVDNFHTGYVLEALDTCARAGIDAAVQPLERGLAYYRARLFLPDGTPKYYAHKTYPIDMWSVAQAIQTFSIASRRDPGFRGPALDVFGFAFREMRAPDGAFLFQRTRHWRNRSRHMRGVVAPMTLSLAHLLAALPDGPAMPRHRPQRAPVGAPTGGSPAATASASTEAS